MRPHSQQIKTALLLLFPLFTLSFFAATGTAQLAFEIEATNVKVYRDGLVHVTQTLIVDELYPKIDLPLLSSSVENLIVLDKNKLAVDFLLNLPNLTVFTLGATYITVEYDTLTLTNKNADVWTLVLNNPYDVILILPRNSTIIYLSNIPAEIDMSGDENSLSLTSDQWEVSYIIPLQQEDQNGDLAGITIPLEYLITVAVAITVTIAAVVLVFLRRRKINFQKIVNRNPGLKKEDIAVVKFLAENGGESFEAQIREQFPDMPRTSLWRLVRRLERMEIVEIKKIGLENQVKLKK